MSSEVHDIAPPAPAVMIDEAKGLRMAMLVATVVAQAAGILFIFSVDYLCSGVE